MKNSTQCVTIFLSAAFLDMVAYTFPAQSLVVNVLHEFTNSTFEFVRKIEASAFWRGKGGLKLNSLF